MRTVVQDKYFLRDLHREIDLYDRKLIHMLKHEVFPTDALRDTAAKKLATKRESLAATAKSLVASGIEYHENDLPRSFRPEGWAEEHVETVSTDKEASADDVAVASLGAAAATDFGSQVVQYQRQALREEESPLASALGSWQDDLAAYKKKRQKAALAATI